ncbi:hypothetical protein Bbelb_334060 [Branchiostoma belcheri]|nr:hypothetical protein Bbelb_334060 [Branchiostoma belcheri]
MGKARGKSKHFRCERQKVTARTVIFDDSTAPKRSVTRVPIPFGSTHTLPQHPCPSTAAAAVDTLFPPQDEPELAPPQTRTTYSKQKIATQESWNNVRDDLFNLMKVPRVNMWLDRHIVFKGNAEPIRTTYYWTI